MAELKRFFMDTEECSADYLDDLGLKYSRIEDEEGGETLVVIVKSIKYNPKHSLAKPLDQLCDYYQIDPDYIEVDEDVSSDESINEEMINSPLF